MPRYVIQSGSSGQFLAPSYEDGQPEWVTLLCEAGIVDDLETYIFIHCFLAYRLFKLHLINITAGKIYSQIKSFCKY